MTREDAIPVIHAYWIKRFYNCYECSNCHNLENMLTRRTNYCKDCGAKMDLGEQTEIKADKEQEDDNT